MTRNEPSDRSAAARGFGALCEWAVDVRLADLPDAVRRRIVLVLGDNLAAMAAAGEEPELRAAHERVIRRGGPRDATIFRAGLPRVSMRDAAVSNGLASTWAELDDGYSKAPSHPGAYSQPALVATAEAEGHSVGAMLRAGVLAYEIGARLASTWRTVVPPVHPHALYNAPCAAAAVGLLRGYDVPTFTRALAGATTLVSPGPYAHATEGALVRNAWPAAGAQLGIDACEWAESGIGGIPESPFDVYAGSFGARTDAAALTDGLGTRWAVTESYHKHYACCQQAHAAIEALGTLVAAHPAIAGEDAIARIEVEVPEIALHLDHRDPPTTLAARFSLPHAIAGALVHGPTSPAAFARASLDDPRIRRLRRRVELAPYPDVKPWPLDRPGRVRLTLANGERLEATCEAAAGSPSRPMGEDALRRKIATLGAPVLPGLPAAIDRLLEGKVDDATPAARWIASFAGG
jgi:2-methylcitrate dehydratase PrpD